MKKMLWVLFAVGLFAALIVSCGDEGSNDDGSDSDGDVDSESESDSELDTESEPVECGGDQEECCDGSCEDGFDPVVSTFAQSCSCQAPCDFASCAAGTEDGYCALMLGAEDLTCYNTLDFPSDMTPSECVVGESCTTNSGDEGGICMAFTDPLAGGELVLCAVLCDTPPEECADGQACAPAFSMDDQGLVLDYTVGHCSPMM